MKPAVKLQQIVVQLAAKHGCTLQRTGAYLRLQLEGHGHLVIENIGAGRVSVTNYIAVGSSLVADPAVVLYTDYRTRGQTEPLWLPIEITDLFDGWRLYAELDLQGNLIVHDLVGQAELAAYCEGVLARNLAAHGWLESAVRSNVARRPWTDEEILARDIRMDEMADAGEEMEA